MFEPATDIRVGGLVIASVAVAIFRIGYRPLIKISGNNLIIDQPLVRWTIPRQLVKKISATRGVILVTTATSEIQPVAFTHSPISNIINGDKHRRAAVNTINDWKKGESYDGDAGSKIRTIKPLLVDFLVFAGGWQVTYSILIILKVI